MSINYGYQPIVTNGLVLHLDAANPNSYRSGSTTWNDLSGNRNNGTLINGPGYSSANFGSITFDGVNDYVALTENISLNLYPITLAVWIKYTKAGELINKYQSGAINGYRIAITTTGIDLYYFIDGSNYVLGYDTGQGGALTQDMFYYVTVTVGSSGATVYRNGQQVGTRAWLGTQGAPTTSQAPSLGRYPGASGFNAFSGSMFSAQIYNRALSATEVLQNYNALKSRYGL